MKIHIFGSSGSGTSTLGKCLSEVYNIKFFDADDYYWKNSETPFTVKNSIEERHRLLLSDMEGLDSWVLSGSMDSWSDPFLPLFDAAIFVSSNAELRCQRLRGREVDRFGDRVKQGGDMFEEHEYFIKWAEQYEQGKLSGRSRQRHEEWLRNLKCPLMRVNNDGCLQSFVNEVRGWLEQNGVTEPELR